MIFNSETIFKHRWTYYVSPAFILIVSYALSDIDGKTQSHWIVWFFCVFLLINGVVNTVMLRWSLRVISDNDISVSLLGLGREKQDRIISIFKSDNGLIFKSRKNYYFVSNDTHKYDSSILASYFPEAILLEISNFEFTKAKYSFGMSVASQKTGRRY